MALPQQEIEAHVSDLEGRIDRLRVLYEQYFLGFEKLEPTVPRKECERRLDILRKENIRNTGLRFRYQRLLQKFNTYQTYWVRICRQIEEGTFKRHLRKAQARFGPGAGAVRPDYESVEVNLDDLDAEMAALQKEGMFDTDRPPAGAAADDDDDNADTVRPPAPAGGNAPAVTIPRHPDAQKLAFERTRPQVAPPAVPGQPTAYKGTNAPAPDGSKPRLVVKKGDANSPGPQPAATPASAAMRAAPAAPPTSGAMRAAAPPASGAMRAAPPAAASSPQIPAAKRSTPGGPGRSGELSDDRIRQLYSNYIEAKRANRESTAAISFDSLAKSLRESSAKLKEKHVGKQVDFEVTMKDGKTILRPVVKS